MAKSEKAAAAPSRKKVSSARKKGNFKLWLMIVPFLVLSFMSSYYPLHGWIYALYDYKAPLPLSKCISGSVLFDILPERHSFFSGISDGNNPRSCSPILRRYHRLSYRRRTEFVSIRS
jgi:hypothetical protein